MKLRDFLHRVLLLILRHFLLGLGAVHKVTNHRAGGLAVVVRGTKHVPPHGHGGVLRVNEVVAKVEQIHLLVGHRHVLVVVQREDQRPILGVQLWDFGEELHRDAAAANRVLLGDDVDGLHATEFRADNHKPRLRVGSKRGIQLVCLLIIGARVVKYDGHINPKQQVVLDLTYEVSRHSVFDQASEHDAWFLVPRPVLSTADRRLNSKRKALLELGC